MSIFATAYLLMPALQAATLAEFHALPLAAPLIAWALWAVEDRRWIEFSVAAVLVMGVQEGMALVAAALGLYAIGADADATGRSSGPTCWQCLQPAAARTIEGFVAERRSVGWRAGSCC